ncbi:MAG: Ku protein [Bryobacterales bacterium]|nr:Ku protein [Bryobacterales bacterium]
MAARAMWKGVLQIEGESLPVKLYSAVQDRTVHFNIVDDRSMQRVKQQMVNPENDKPVEPAAIRKGYEAGPGEYVLLNEEELASLIPPASRDIEIVQFVKPATLAPQWFNRPYYLGPDDNSSDYFALAKAMAEEEVDAFARWVMRNKRYQGILHAEGDYLMLITVRHAEEVLGAKELAPGAETRALDKREVSMARQLVEALQGEFDPLQFNDAYRQRVQELVEAKAAGEKPRLAKMPKKKTVESLADALEASLRAAKRSAA